MGTKDAKGGPLSARVWKPGGNPPGDESMDKEEIQTLIDKSKQEAMDMSKEQIDILKKEIKKIGGEKPPGGNNMPMDPELKVALDEIGKGMQRQADALGILAEEKTKVEQEETLEKTVERRLEPIKAEVASVSKEVKRVEQKFCNEDGTVCFPTKAELEDWKKKQEGELKKAREELKPKPGHPAEYIHPKNGKAMIHCPDCEPPITEAVLLRIREDEEYRKRFVAEQCKDKECRTDIYNHLLDTATGEEKEKLEKEKKFFLVKEK